MVLFQQFFCMLLNIWNRSLFRTSSRFDIPFIVLGVPILFLVYLLVIILFLVHLLVFILVFDFVLVLVYPFDFYLMDVLVRFRMKSNSIRNWINPVNYYFPFLMISRVVVPISHSPWFFLSSFICTMSPTISIGLVPLKHLCLFLKDRKNLSLQRFHKASFQRLRFFNTLM